MQTVPSSNMGISSMPKGDQIGLPDDRPEDGAPHILVVDDDSRIRELLSRYLSEQGFRVSTSADAADARRKMEGLSFDLLVVDVMMPGENGTDLTRSIRTHNDVPVLMLTALGETDARIMGLEAGADDYLAKPFDPRELVLRINSILKRVVVEEPHVAEQILFGPYTFSIAARELRRDGEVVKLTDREREIMVLFAINAGETVHRMDLVGQDASANERTVDVQINRLRRKIERDPASPTWLQTVRGIGYRLQMS